MKYRGQKNNNSNVSISMVQNKLSPVALMADQTNMSLVFRHLLVCWQWHNISTNL